jgi:transcription initiation factor TFIIIB Brf1 subunit/transcription initiation factor TFIIB
MEKRCPSCQSTDLAEPDRKGLVECRQCGRWQHPVERLPQPREVPRATDEERRQGI